MSLKRLNSGYLEPLAQMPAPEAIPAVYDRKALLVYTGTFDSMDGEVEVKDEDIERLVANHNGFLASFSRVINGDFPLHAMPPMQLDHSVSAAHTVGRVPGMLEMGTIVVPAKLDERGNMLQPERQAKAVFGSLRFLGRDNVEKAMDGRYCHLSVGADFKKGKLQEVSVTPFPAAGDARLLSAKRQSDTDAGEETYKGKKIKVFKGDHSDWYYKVDGEDQQYGPCQKPEDAWAQARQCVEGLITSAKLKGEPMLKRLTMFLARLSKLSEQEAEKKLGEMPQADKDKLAADEKAEHERMKKYLTGYKKMSDEDAEKHLGDMNMDKVKELAAEVDEHEKKLAAETEEAQRAEAVKAEQHKKNMTAKREELTRLSTDLRAKMDSTRMAARKTQIGARLSSLKAAMKITPAEIKKIDVSKLAAETDATIDAVLKSYSEREPVIITGMLGSRKGVETSTVAKASRLSKLEQETLANMPFTSRAAKNRLANGEKGKEEEGAPDTVNIHIDTDPHTDFGADMDAAFKLMDEGKMPEAKEHLKGMLGKYAKRLAGEDAGAGEVEMSALAENLKSMQTDLTQVMQLASTLAGAEEKK